MDKQSEHAKRWVEKARSDLLNADNNLAAQKVPYDTVCFHCQQAAQKVFEWMRSRLERLFWQSQKYVCPRTYSATRR